MRVTEIKGEWRSRKNDGGGFTVSGKLSLEFIEIHDGCEGEREGSRRKREREREDGYGRDSSLNVSMMLAGRRKGE